MPRLFELLMDPQFALRPDEGAGGDAGDPSAQAVADAPGGDAGTSGVPATDAPEPEGEERWSIADVPEDQRELASRIERHFKGEFTRKTQELAQEREQLEEARELWEALHDEERSEQTLNALAAALGFEPADIGEPEPSETTGDDEDELAGLDPAAAELIRGLRGEVESLKEERDGRVSAETQKAMREHVMDGISAYEARIGVEELDPAVSRPIVLAALALPPTEDGKPDIDGAIGLWEDAEKQVIARYVASKKAEAPQVDGTSGVESVDLSSPKARRERALAIVGRHL